MADATRNPTERATWLQSAGNWLRKLDAAKATENQGLDLSECSSNMDTDTTKCKVLSRTASRSLSSSRQPLPPRVIAASR